MIKQLGRDISEALPCRNGLRLTHFFFVDDSLLFCKASIQECNHIQDILSEYEVASSQKLNKDKTTLFFNKVTSQNTQESIINLLGVPEIKQYEKYLGLPSFVGREKKGEFCFHQREGLVQIKGIEGKAPFPSRQGSPHQSNNPSASNLCQKLLQTTFISLP